jgi:hypothetical protein
MSSPRLNYYGFGDTDSIMIAAMATAGLAVFPTTVGLFALYRIRRWHGHLHGLPLAFAASITWPLIVFDIIIVAIISAISNASEGPIVFAILLGLASNTLAFIYGWGAAKRPLDAAARV